MTSFNKLLGNTSLIGSVLSFCVLVGLDCWTDVCKNGVYIGEVYDPRPSREANYDFVFFKSSLLFIFSAVSIIFVLGEVKKERCWTISFAFKVLTTLVILLFMFVSFIGVVTGGRVGSVVLG